MDERDWLAERFEEHRTRLRAVAYRMLGSLSEADDAVQEAWLRLSRTDTGKVENLGSVWTREALAACELLGVPSRTNQDMRDAIAAALTARDYEQGRCQRFGDIVVPSRPAASGSVSGTP